MASNDRLNMFPSRANQVLMKQRIGAAQRGLNALKRKREALDLKLRGLNSELKATLALLPGTLQEAYSSMARARYLRTDLEPAKVMGAERADASLRLAHNKVAGLQLPVYELVLRPPTCFPLAGLAAGGAEVNVMRQKFQEALQLLVQMASLQYSVQVLKEGVKSNNMRVNGLDYVVIPRFINTLNYIANELEEYEREDFFRLKRSQANQRAKKAEQAAIQKEREGAAMPKRKSPTTIIVHPMMEGFNMENFELDSYKEGNGNMENFELGDSKEGNGNMEKFELGDSKEGNGNMENFELDDSKDGQEVKLEAEGEGEDDSKEAQEVKLEADGEGEDDSEEGKEVKVEAEDEVEGEGEDEDDSKKGKE